MNDGIDFPGLFEKNVRQLQTYLSDPLPLSEDRLFARRSYEEMLKNQNHDGLGPFATITSRSTLTSLILIQYYATCATSSRVQTARSGLQWASH
jgi:hypothetical protein